MMKSTYTRISIVAILFILFGCGGGGSSDSPTTNNHTNSPSDTYYYGASSGGYLNVPIRLKFTGADPVSTTNSVPVIADFIFFGDLHTLTGTFNAQAKSFQASDAAFVFHGNLNTSKARITGSFTSTTYSSGIFICEPPTNSINLDLCFSGIISGNANGHISMWRDGNLNIIGCAVGYTSGGNFSNFFQGSVDATSQFQVTGLDSNENLDPNIISATGLLSINGTTTGSGRIITDGCSFSLTRQPSLP
ncbi:hypothetical protein [Geothrix sp. SG200]|uniref:hypothetical protein n=1 Tax=Geothrix sp. SG200 TaxID=2922865 RepID=UPI001FACD5DB|nr:hypothetical protein [Geothrix sp. SG200]